MPIAAERVETARQQFEMLFQRTQCRAYRLAYCLTRNASDAEDVIQEAYLRAWQHFGRFEADRSFEAWLLTIITHRALDLLRRRKRVRFYSLDQVITCELADPDADPHEIVVGLLLEERLAEAVEALPAHYREVVRLFFVEECPYQEIAARMGCAVGTVRSRIHRARLLLRDQVAAGADLSLYPSRPSPPLEASVA